MASQEGSRGISRACQGSRARVWGVRGGGGRGGWPAGNRAKQGLLDDSQATSQLLHLLLHLPPPAPNKPRKRETGLPSLLVQRMRKIVTQTPHLTLGQRMQQDRERATTVWFSTPSYVMLGGGPFVCVTQHCRYARCKANTGRGCCIASFSMHHACTASHLHHLGKRQSQLKVSLQKVADAHFCWILSMLSHS